jgi:ABC-type microcin C transport system permease subunit YejE
MPFKIKNTTPFNMKTKLFLVLFLVVLSTNLLAQNTPLLIGKWVFKDVLDKSRMNKEGLKMLNTKIINKMTFDFVENGEFKAYAMGENMTGTWILSKDAKKIILKTSEKETYELLILGLSKNRLELKLGLGRFLMVKN